MLETICIVTYVFEFLHVGVNRFKYIDYDMIAKKKIFSGGMESCRSGRRSAVSHFRTETSHVPAGGTGDQ